MNWELRLPAEEKTAEKTIVDNGELIVELGNDASSVVLALEAQAPILSS